MPLDIQELISVVVKLAICTFHGAHGTCWFANLFSSVIIISRGKVRGKVVSSRVVSTSRRPSRGGRTYNLYTRTNTHDYIPSAFQTWIGREKHLMVLWQLTLECNSINSTEASDSTNSTTPASPALAPTGSWPTTPLGAASYLRLHPCQSQFQRQC